MPAYSFQDVLCSFIGPGAIISLGNGAGVSKEGISWEPLEDKDAMVIGADGTPMHSLHAGNGATCTIRLLKNSPANALLSAAYWLQAANSANWGQNTIGVGQSVLGDVATMTSVAFRRNTGNTWAEDANMLEWQFNVGKLIDVKGAAL
jgi:hypothetical protein